MKRQYNIEQAALNIAIADKISITAMKNNDPDLWRGPRLLVPVELDVLVVTEENQNQGWADVKFDPDKLEGYAEKKAAYYGQEEPESNSSDDDPNLSRGSRIPFADYEHRETGIYLHWSLPDGLTHGKNTGGDTEEDATESSDIIKEQADIEIRENTEFPLIPDRWMVVRIYPGASSGSKRRVSAWVIKSEEPDPAKRVISLNSFSEDRENADTRWMTALGEGDPAYAAYYDNVKGVLGFYDDMQGVDAGPVTYTVMGWYSDKNDDPLFAPANRSRWLEKLDELCWSLGDDAEDAEKRLAEAAKAAKDKWESLGLHQNYYDALSPAFEADTTLAATAPLNTASNNFGTTINSAAYNADTPFYKSSLGSVIKETPQTSAVSGYFHSDILGLSEAAKRVIISEDAEFKNYWPRQMLCHGMTYSVLWNQGGGTYDIPEAGMPAPNKIKVAVGNTGVESLAALIAKESGLKQAEKLYAAFHYGLLSEIQERDGLANLESLLHSEDFESRPGGFVTDTIMQGDAFPDLSSDEANKIKMSGSSISAREKTFADYDTSTMHYRTAAEAQPESGQPESVHGRSKGQVQRKFSIKKEDITITRDRHDFFVNPEGAANIANPRKAITIRRAMPRFWEPKDPVILFSEARRSYKHGEDSRLSHDNKKMLCRITGETVISVGLVVGIEIATHQKALSMIYPDHISSGDVLTGQVPVEASDIFHEALLLDEENAQIAANHIMGKQDNGELSREFPAKKYQINELNENLLINSFRVQATMLNNIYINPYMCVQTAASFSGIEGRMPLPFAVKPWCRPWIPLHMDWEVEWLPSDSREADWQLGEFDYDTNKEADLKAQESDGISYRGTTLITPAVTRSLTDKLDKFIADELNDTSDIADEQQETMLEEISEAFKNIDVLAGSLSGFHDYLMARLDDYAFSPVIDSDGKPVEEKTLSQLEQEKRELEGLPEHPVRAGRMRLKQLRIVDAFGQYVDLSNNILQNAVKAEDMRASDETPELIRLAPRIVNPARLMFRLVQAKNDNLDATKNKIPVCGWILPDHLDEALEIYDGNGNNLGQVQRHRPKAGEIITSSLGWQGVPGNPGSFGAPPELDNTHMQRMIKGLLAQGEKDALLTQETGESVETALGALLRMIDSTLWTVDPLGREGSEHLSVLVGRPLAVVRASLRLEIDDLDSESELARTPFNVRLGDLKRLGDGLVGYFINDDYSQFYPIHEEIADKTRPVRPHYGFMGAIQAVNNYYQDYDNNFEPVTHSYINTEPFAKVRPLPPGLTNFASKSVMLTLIIDPRGGVHAASGILPTKKIELMREHTAQALENISMTFRVGPVLSDPETIRMPLPGEITGNFSWVRKTGLTVWEESPVVGAVPEPKLSTTPSQINEGWLKLSGAYDAEKKDD